MAGIWDHWKNEGQGIGSCCIITLDTIEQLGSIHGRMPAIIAPEHYDAWLDSPNHPWVEVKTLFSLKIGLWPFF